MHLGEAHALCSEQRCRWLVHNAWLGGMGMCPLCLSARMDRGTGELWVPPVAGVAKGRMCFALEMEPRA